MKTRFWILLFLSIAVVCAGLSIWLLGGKAETTAEVYSDGKLVQTIDLAVDGEYRIELRRRLEHSRPSPVGRSPSHRPPVPRRTACITPRRTTARPSSACRTASSCRFSTPSELDALLA